MDSGIARLQALLPATFRPFANTEYPMPVSQAMLGAMPDVAELRAWLARAEAEELKHRCEPAAVAAEVIESAAADRDTCFLDDGKVRSAVFGGAKWRAGWVLLAGDGISEELVQTLKNEQYMIFSSRFDALRTTALPPRETAPIYFLQLMVRYAMIWGQIPPGEDHTMGHFLETDMPGAMIVQGSVGPAECLLLLAIMKMGCPAVVDDAFPYDVGPRAVAHTTADVLAALKGFPNMRVRCIDGRELTLPGGADPAHARQQVKPARTLTGVFQLRAGSGASGVKISGDPSANEVAAIVEVTDPRLDLPMTAYLEAEALGFGSYLPGVNTRRSDAGQWIIDLAEGVALNPQLLGELIIAALKRKYPRLGQVGVRLHFGAQAVRDESIVAAEINRLRDEAIVAESEATVSEFHLCIDCQPFSHSHVCVVTPERVPMCGRSRYAIKAGALWGVDYRPWTRRHLAHEDLQIVAAKGRPIDARAGEYEGLNTAVARMTGDQVQRVRIHAVCEAPHTSCGCFGALAFAIPEVGGIGIMHRGYEGEAPGGLTWSILANRAGGKQCPGVTGIALKYLESPGALGGEGGLAAVKWATTKAYEIMQPYLPHGMRVATEDEATTVEELKCFLKMDSE